MCLIRYNACLVSRDIRVPGVCNNLGLGAGLRFGSKLGWFIF